jgi:hypothetical protein
VVRRGYLTDSNPDDYIVIEMNMGWELPGTFDVSIQIQDVDTHGLARGYLLQD